MAARKLICRIEKRDNIRNVLLYFRRLPAQPTLGETTVELTAKQRQSIEKNYAEHPSVLAGKIQTGGAMLSIAPNNMVKWMEFYPMGYNPSQVVLRKGIASRVHSEITERIAAEFPSHEIIHNTDIEDRRISHLRTMGIDPYFAYAMKDYLAAVRRHMTEQKKKGK